MINVVANADVWSEELFAHAFVEAGALVFQGGGGEIVKKKPDEIEHRRGRQALLPQRTHGQTALRTKNQHQRRRLSSAATGRPLRWRGNAPPAGFAGGSGR